MIVSTLLTMQATNNLRNLDADDVENLWDALGSMCVPALKFAVSMVFPFTRNEVTRSTLADTYGLPWDGDYSVPITGSFTSAQSQSSEQDDRDDEDDNCEFVGYHGTTQDYASNLTQGVFDLSLSGANTGANRLQFGEGIYVVKAMGIADDNALGLAEFFGIQAQQNQNSPAVVLKVCAIGFSSMSRLLHKSGSATLPPDYLSYDYIEGTISRHPGYTQIKFNPHAFGKLRLTW